MKLEGLAERVGDIVLGCSGGTPGFTVTGNLSVSMAVPLGNRLTPGTGTDILFTADTGSGPVPVPFTAQQTAPSTVSLNGISFTIPASGMVTLRISNLRGSMISAAVNQPVVAFLAINGPSPLALANNQLVVAFPQRGLLTGNSSTVIRCVGSPLPATISMSNFFGVGTHFESTRLTEGYAADFQVRGPTESNGTRFIIGYKNVPTGIMLFVPDVIAGSDALSPTAGGDLGVRQSGGAYQPGSNTLLLARVQGADSAGNGGAPIYIPPPAGPAVLFDSATQLTITGGSASVVYEVVDAGNTVLEDAQFPTFVGLASTAVSAGTAQETVSFAPVSTDSTASSSAPIPRFAALQPPSDCTVLSDCGAAYFPSLVVTSQGVFFTVIQGGLPLQPPGYIGVGNANSGGSVLNWTASLVYKDGSDWLILEGTSGLNFGSVRVFGKTQKLAPGTYNASVVIDAGLAGVKTVPVQAIVTALPPAPPPPAITPPGITSIANSANFLPGPVVSGSLATLKGTNLGGKAVSVTFDGTAAKILMQSDTRIDVLVPDGLGDKPSSQVVVTVDGTSSPAMTVPVATVAPAIFSDGVRNADNTVNNATNGAPVGSEVQILVTGLPENLGTVLVKIHDREDLVPDSAGAVAGSAGVYQVSVAVPADLPAMTTTTLVCGLDASGNKVCSAAAPITLADAPDASQ